MLDTLHQMMRIIQEAATTKASSMWHRRLPSFLLIQDKGEEWTMWGLLKTIQTTVWFQQCITHQVNFVICIRLLVRTFKLFQTVYLEHQSKMFLDLINCYEKCFLARANWHWCMVEIFFQEYKAPELQSMLSMIKYFRYGL